MPTTVIRRVREARGRPGMRAGVGSVRTSCGPRSARQLVASAGFRPDELVVEIGAGRGALTLALAEHPIDVDRGRARSRLVGAAARRASEPRLPARAGRSRRLPGVRAAGASVPRDRLASVRAHDRHLPAPVRRPGRPARARRPGRAVGGGVQAGEPAAEHVARGRVGAVVGVPPRAHGSLPASSGRSRAPTPASSS